MDTLYEYLFSESDFYKRIQKARKTKGESDFVSRLSVFVLLCMGVCGERGSEGGDVGSSVCCLCFKLMLYEIILEKKRIKIKKKVRSKREGIIIRGKHVDGAERGKEKSREIRFLLLLLFGLTWSVARDF